MAKFVNAVALTLFLHRQFPPFSCRLASNRAERQRRHSIIAGRKKVVLNWSGWNLSPQENHWWPLVEATKASCDPLGRDQSSFRLQAQWWTNPWDFVGQKCIIEIEKYKNHGDIKSCPGEKATTIKIIARQKI